MLDGPGKDRSHIQEFALAAGGVAGFGNGVQEDHFPDGTFLQPLVGGARQNPMGGAGVDLPGAAQLHKGLGGVAQGTGGIHHVVTKNAGFSFDIADDVHDLGDVGLGAALVHNGQTHMDLGGDIPGAAHGAYVGRDNHEVLVIEPILRKFLHEVVDEGDIAQQMIQRDVEEALDLGGVQVHGQDPVGAGGGEHIRHKLGGDGVPGFGLAVLAGVAKVGDHRGDPPGGGPSAGVDHDQKLHKMVVDGLTGGLNQKNVGAADGLLQGNGSLSVGKLPDIRFAQFNAQFSADGFGKFGI